MADNQPRDDHAKKLKQTVSTVKQLRGWVASDPTRTEDFVDALNEATGLRVLSRAWAEAAPEAAEAVGAADKLVRSRGPIGPYTPVVDAARYFTALTHVATVQLGMGLVEPAGSTIGAALAWKDQLTERGLGEALVPRTAIWSLLTDARTAMARGDLAHANAMADSALAMARRSVLEPDHTPVLLDALHTVADARTSVGLPDQAVELLREAVSVWQEWTESDFTQLPRMAKPHLERLITPAVQLHRSLVAALWQVGRGDEALDVLEHWCTLLHRSAPRRGEPGRVDVALARSDQAWLLAEAGRGADSLKASEAAQQAMNALLKAEKPVGQHLATQLAVCASRAHAELATGRVDAAAASIDQVYNRLQAHRQVTVPEAARGLAHWVRADVLSAAGDEATATASRTDAEQIADALREQLMGSGLLNGEGALAVLLAGTRHTALPGNQPTPHWDVPDALDALSPAGAPVSTTVLSDEEAMRLIDEQREQEARERAVAELRAATERAERERAQAERRAEARRVEEAAAVQSAAGQEAEETARREAEETARREAEETARREAEETARREAEETARREAEETARREAEQDPVARARQAVDRAQNSTDKQELVEALEGLVHQLEPLAPQDPQGRGRELVRALEQLSDAQGWWGGRAAGKRAKQLSKQWGL
ncbi:hypothetical protein ACTQ49_08825 [Luteococcus sp. Sow4_B9]|uniref:hypothetical protein n=1 Tax=Luteococcus sp. Sow4_B9 TaxID=3438792 RepID=UPI003F9AF3E6